MTPTKRNRPVSVAGAARRAKSEDKKIRDQLMAKEGTHGISTVDSFQNLAQHMGMGTEGPMSTAGYGFNPITRVRTTLEWIHRGSWLGGVAVDVIADDMTRAGVTIKGILDPSGIERIQESVTALGIWQKLNETIKWARLYGGALAVLLIEGQDYSTPLRLETIDKGQMKGLLVLDRWMVEPSLSNLIQEPGPNLGLPKFYTITADAPALPRMKIHYSRCVRLTGIDLPYWQKLQENLWGISVLERLYDRMIGFDSASTGAFQMVYKAFIRTYKVKDMREIVAAGGPALRGLYAYMEMIRRFQGNEGITLMDSEDEFEGTENNSMTGIAEVLKEAKEQLAGALQIPLVRLFGQSPSGFSTGDSDMRMYYDSIKQKQEDDLKVGVTAIYRAVARSEGVTPPDGFGIEFNSLWQLSETDKAVVAETVSRAVTAASESGLISDQVALKELRQSSQITGLFTNISQEDIDNASEEVEEPPIPGLPPGPDDAPHGARKVEEPEHLKQDNGLPPGGNENAQG